MSHRRTPISLASSALGFATALLLLVSSCGEPTAPPSGDPPQEGSIRITASTTGSEPDADGYTVSVDGGAERALGQNGSVTFSDLSVGNHTVAVSGVAANCSVAGAVTRTVSVAGGQTTDVQYDVTCSATTGSLAVTATTSGQNPDPDGYTVTVDGGQQRALAANGSVTYTGLTARSHTVAISGVAANCTVAGGLSQTVGVQAGSTAQAAFDVSCSTTSGAIDVSVTTSGSDPDPDGYSVTVDGGQATSIGVNGSTSFTGLSVGSHTVVISGVAANCSVNGGNTQTPSVVAGSTTQVSYQVTCTAVTGTLQVSASTSGGTLDPNGYTLTIDGQSQGTLGVNQTRQLSVTAGNHTIVLGGLASNCTITNGNASRTINVPSAGTGSTTYDVNCPTPGGTLQVSASTSGGTPDPNGYTLTIDGQSQGTLNINQTRQFSVSAGNHTVVLGGLASNCSITNGNASRQVNVPSAGTGSTTYNVDCPTPGGTLQVSASTSGGTPDPNGYTLTIDGQSQGTLNINQTRQFSVTAGNHTVVLAGLAANCSITNGNASRQVNVPSAGTGSTTYDVDCPTPGGTLQVSASTSGGTPDPNGYTLTIDGQSQGTLGVNQTRQFSVSAGNHTVILSGLASNCTITNGNASRQVNVPSAGTGSTTYDVDCPTPGGTLQVSASTSGGTPDPNGYTLTIDGQSQGTLGVNQTRQFSVTAGNHTVVLAGLAANCTITNGNTSRQVNVPSAGTGSTTYDVNCPTPGGTLQVSASTTGGTPDPNGYTLTIDGQSQGTLNINQTRQFSVTAGNHTVILGGLASNCTITNGNASRQVDVPSAGTGSTTYNVDCPTPGGTLQVSASTTGGTPDPNGYTLTIDGQSQGTLNINQTRQFSVSAGDHTVLLGGLASNCSITNGNASRQVNVPSAGTGSTTYNVNCPSSSTIDLVAGALSVTPTNPTDGQTITIQGSISNTGSGASGAFSWSIEVDGQEVASGRPSGLAAGATLTTPIVASNVGPFSSANRVATLIVDTQDEIVETDEGNNQSASPFFVTSPGFDIVIRFLGSPTASQAQAFTDAANRWQSIILNDEVDIPLVFPATGCSPALDETIDDVVIYVEFAFKDGPGGILGSAGPCIWRTANLHPLVGFMSFDTADLPGLEAAGQLEDVAIHEMGHVLGIGSFWSAMGLVTGAGGSDPYFTGTEAIAAFDSISNDTYGGNPVPVANTGGSGTRDVHWRESELNNELMTGFLNSGVNPLSVVTVESLEDQGYTVDPSQADPFSLDFSLRLPGAPETLLHLKGDVRTGTGYGVDSSGRHTTTVIVQ